MEILNEISNSLSEVGKFLFESYTGIIVLIVSCLLITLLISILLEFKTRKQFVDHPIEESEDDDE